MVSPTTTFDACPETEEGYETARAYLGERFTSWAEHNDVQLGPDCFEQLIHYKWGYLDEHLTRWTRADLDEVYLDLYPAKVVTDDAEASIAEASVFVDFLDQTGLLDPASDDPAALRAHLEAIRPEFFVRMADESLFSPGKRLWSSALAEGVPLDDDQAIQAFVQRFNARSFDQRQSLLGPAPIAPRVGTGRFTPPGTPPRPKAGKRRRRR